jgi:hypothetical protein
MEEHDQQRAELRASEPLAVDGAAPPTPPELPHVPRMSWALGGAAAAAVPTLTTQGPTQQPGAGAYQPGAGVDIIGADASAVAAGGGYSRGRADR